MLADSFGTIFLSFYIWQSSRDLLPLITYHLVMFLTIAPFGSLAGYLSEKISPKIGFSLGLLINVMIFMSAAVFHDFFLSRLSTFGFLSGVAIGLYAISQNQIHESLSEDLPEKMGSARSAISGLVSLLVPSFAALALAFGLQYSFLFLTSAALYLSSVINLLSLKLPRSTDTKFELLSTLLPSSTNPEKPLLFWSIFIDGIKSGLLWVVGPIISLSLIGTIGRWGIYNFFFTLLGIALDLWLIKHLKAHTNKYCVILASLLFSLGCLLLGTNLTFSYFLLYSLTLVIYNSIASSAYSGTISRLMRQDADFPRLRNEYFSAIEYPLALGRIIPLIVLLLFQVTTLDSQILQLTIVGIGTIPIITFSILNFSRLWSNTFT